ncbi:MAG: alanine racemase [Gemmatimonadaceae bacterium]
MRRAWIEVDLDALVRNATAVQRHSGKPILPMIKADAYGLGAVEVARVLEPLDPWALGIALLGEAAELRRFGIDRRVLVFSPLLPEDFPEARRLRVTPTLGTALAIRAWIESGGGAWHLAIDTGMNRAGVEWWRVGAVTELARQLPPEGAFTHFHSADTDHASVREQQERFRRAVDMLPCRPEVLHAENSPAIERQSPSPWDLVRPGVFLYGVGGGPGSGLIPEPVAHLRARVVEVHDVRDGESVSYGATWRAEGARRIATLAIGYADGYRRLFSSRGEVILAGRRVRVVGRVTMDLTMVDVTGVPCAEGDVATLLGRAGDDHLDINIISEAVDLLPYELLVGLKLRAPRIYHRGEA